MKKSSKINKIFDLKKNIALEMVRLEKAICVITNCLEEKYKRKVLACLIRPDSRWHLVKNGREKLWYLEIKKEKKV